MPPKRPPLQSFSALIRSMLAAGSGPTAISLAIGHNHHPESIRAWGRRNNLAFETTRSWRYRPVIHWAEDELLFVWQACLEGRSYWHMATALNTYPARVQRLCSQLEISNHRRPSEARAMDKFQPEVEANSSVPHRLCLSCGFSFKPQSRYLFRCDPCKSQGLGDEGWGFATKGSKRKSAHHYSL